MSTPLQPLAIRHDVGDIIKERYTVREVLGAGAFGTVYRVEEKLGTRLLTLACKEMHVLDNAQTGLSEREQALAMFQEEAYLLQTLRHPHIPTAHFEPARGVWLACPVCGRTFKGARTCPDHGTQLQVVKERFYLLMDFIEGPDLEAKLQENNGRPLPEEQVLDWSLQVCDALALVHAQGFSHRDIKPANIKLQSRSDARGGNGSVMLIDFGLVKPSSTVGGYGTQVLSGVGGRMGTPGYAPPTVQEQSQPDARTDILALGMTLYRLLTGLDPTEPAHLEMMRAKSPAAFNPTLSSTVNEIIKKAIQPDPAHRYPNVEGMLSDLRAARYPLVTVCRHCGWELHSARPPAPDTPCGRCGRPLSSSTQDAAASSKKSAPRPASSRPAASSPSAPASSPAPAPRLNKTTNPYQARIDELLAQIRGAAPPPSNPRQARVGEIEAQLALYNNFTPQPGHQCPACRQAELKHVTGQPTGRCPLCDTAPLHQRKYQENRCPICHENALAEQQLPEHRLFCPVCRAGILEEEHRSKFIGLAADLWLRCPNCVSQFDVVSGRRVKLAECGPRTGNECRALLGRTLSMDEWRRQSGRSNRYFACGYCHAQIDAPDDEHWSLVTVPRDMHAVHARYGAQVMPRRLWAKIAHGLPPTAGEMFCERCKADFNYDDAQRTLTLLSSVATVPDWARTALGSPIPLTTWYSAIAGKVSKRPGWLCPSCRTEWDEDGILWKLIAARSPRLAPFVTAALRFEDWQRRAAGIPISDEVRDLKAETARLKAESAQEEAARRQQEGARRGEARRVLRDVLKQSVLEGHLPLQRVSGDARSNNWISQSGIVLAYPANHLQFAARPGEVVHWTGPAWTGSLMWQSGELAWRSFDQAMLVATNERILFGSQAMVWWWRELSRYQGSDLYPTPQNTTVLGLHFTGDADPSFFEIGPVTWKLVIDGEVSDMLMQPADMLEVLRNVKH